jgi:hypothetical protein
MRVVAPATEDDMVAGFLRAEVGSQRFGPQVLAALAHEGLDRSVLQRPDTTDSAADAARRRVLAAYRGYPDREVFTDLPADTVWQWVALTRRELPGVRYLDWTTGWRSPRVRAAQSMRSRASGTARTAASWPPRSPPDSCRPS